MGGVTRLGVWTRPPALFSSRSECGVSCGQAALRTHWGLGFVPGGHKALLLGRVHDGQREGDALRRRLGRVGNGQDPRLRHLHMGSILVSELIDFSEPQELVRMTQVEKLWPESSYSQGSAASERRVGLKPYVSLWAIPRHLTADTVSCKAASTVTTRATCLSQVEK